MKIEDLLSNNKNPSSSPEKGKRKGPLDSLKIDLNFYKESIREVSVEMIAEEYTQHPIFIAHQHEVALGELILNREELGTGWSINASSLEDFIEKGVIQEDKKDFFIKNYKDPSEFMCLFVVVPEGANFVYYPYK